MGKRCWLLLVVWLCCAAPIWGQDIIFCLDHTDNGLPLGSGKEFELERHGQNVDILFRNKEPIRTDKLYYFIDYEENGHYAEFDTKTSVADHNKTWDVLSYRFTRSGRYRVLVMDANKKEICRAEVLVNVKEEENSPEYYDGAHLVFCHSANKGQPDTLLEAIRVPSGTAETLAVFVRHIRPFKTRRIYVDIWVGSGTGAGMYLETVEFSLDPSWTYSQFAYEFRGAGVYTFRVYNEDEIWIATSKLEVMME
jgi:hypothetical protein